MLYVVKRDGRKAHFDSNKIKNAIKLAANEIAYDLKESENIDLTNKCVKKIESLKVDSISVESIQDIVENILFNNGYEKVGETYSNYRQERTRIRGIKSDLMEVIDQIGVETDRDNANVGNNFSSKFLRIASESNKWHNLAVMPKSLAKAHENGDLYYHDLDSYNLTINCINIETAKILKNGFNTGYGTVNPPKRIETAAELSCILLQSSQNDMFGGQSHVNFDNDMAYFIKLTRREITNEIIDVLRSTDKYKDLSLHNIDKFPEIKDLIEKKLVRRTEQAMQGIVYNLNTMHSRAGSQVPFSSINLGVPKNDDAALVCEIFLKEYEKGLGKGEQPIFPNIIFRVKQGVNRDPGDPYYYLYELACSVASKRMNPMFMNLDANFNKEFYDKGILPATMGCRTYVCSNINGEEGPEGRGNIAPVTINLPRLGILAKGDLDKFFELLNSRLDLARLSLQHRYDVLKKLKVKDLPFVAGEKLLRGSENLNENDSIEPILKQGTFAIGFIGLAETLVALTGKHHGMSARSQKLGLDIIRHIRNFCDKYKNIDKLNYSCYATPAEGLSGRFIVHDKKVFGKIPGVTDKDYYTNSYHVPVGYPISIKDKIDIEAPYHSICNGGHITYIELDDYPEAEDVKAIMDYAYKNTDISYMGINFHIKYCKNCGTYLKNHETQCPNCKSTNIQGISRVTGYLSLDERFGAGKTAERKDRLAHTGNHKKVYQNLALKMAK